jgi:hypothetical protein
VILSLGGGGGVFGIRLTVRNPEVQLATKRYRELGTCNLKCTSHYSEHYHRPVSSSKQRFGDRILSPFSGEISVGPNR